jgi:hypothetical protein
MDRDWLTMNAKVRDRQSRLAFVVALASQVASRRGDAGLAAALSERVGATGAVSSRGRGHFSDGNP